MEDSMENTTTPDNEEKVKAEESENANEEVEDLLETEQEEENVVELNQTQDDESYKEKFYYLAAEMENLKKRYQREKENIVKYGKENVLSDLIEVVDNLERVTSALQGDDDDKVKNIVTGIDMVKKQFTDVLSKNGLTQLETIGEQFDPNYHEAIAQEENEEKKNEEILKELMKGYVLNGRLLRAAKVIIAKSKK